MTPSSYRDQAAENESELRRQKPANPRLAAPGGTANWPNVIAPTTIVFPISLAAEPSRLGERASCRGRALDQPNNGVRSSHALTLIPDHPKGAGQLDAIAARRNSEPILEQPAEMRRTAEAV